MSHGGGIQIAPMAFYATASYRVSDPLENLQLRVTLRKRGTLGLRLHSTGSDTPGAPAAAPSGRRQRRRDGAGADVESVQQRDEGEEGEAPPLQAEEEETRVVASRTFRWQEKVFAPYEVQRHHGGAEDEPPAAASRRSFGGLTSRFGRSGAPAGFVHSQLREQLEQLERSAAESGGVYEGELLHSRVNAESDVDAGAWAETFTSSLNQNSNGSNDCNEEQR